MAGAGTSVASLEVPFDIRIVTGDRTIAFMAHLILLPMIDRMDAAGPVGALAAIGSGEGSS